MFWIHTHNWNASPKSNSQSQKRRQPSSNICCFTHNWSCLDITEVAIQMLREWHQNEAKLYSNSNCCVSSKVSIYLFLQTHHHCWQKQWNSILRAPPCLREGTEHRYCTTVIVVTLMSLRNEYLSVKERHQQTKDLKEVTTCRSSWRCFTTGGRDTKLTWGEKKKTKKPWM